MFCNKCNLFCFFIFQVVFEFLDEIVLLIVVVVYDVDYFGYMNFFFCNVGNEFVIFYNDIVVLESYYVVLVFKFIVCDERFNIFKGFDM